MIELELAADLIEQADALVIVAGAGMGVDSGLPDFRGNAGFWSAYPALAEARISFAEVACPATFHSDPALAWGFYGHRLALYRGTVPHAGFQILRRWSSRMLHGSFVFTSNVDGQFQKAGFADEAIHECHGSIHRLQCLRPCSDKISSADGLMPSVDVAACRWLGELPTCPRCEALMRPNILMFGDGGWLAWPYDKQRSRLASWLRRVTRPVVVEVGAGTSIPTARNFSHRIVHEFTGRLVRIDPRAATVPSPRDAGLALGALDGLSAIEAILISR